MSWMLLILVITVIASYQAFNRPTLKEQLLYHPYRVKTFPGMASDCHACICTR